MGSGPNPGIWGDAVRKALNPNEERGARAHETGAEQALLDKAELQELELSGVYSEPPQSPEATPGDRPSRLRALIDRMVRRPE